MFSKKVLAISESINIRIADNVRRLERQGKKILKLQTGDPDFATPGLIVEKAIESMKDGGTHYCSSRGLPELREAITEKLAKKNGINCDFKKHIMVTHGGVCGVYVSLMGIINQGDEVIIISPYWMPYRSNIVLAGGTPVVVTTSMSNDFKLNIEDVKNHITNKTKAIIINSPSNPTGVVYDSDALKDLGLLCKQHGLHIISDEVYEDLIYEGEHCSIQSLFPDYDRIISVYSFSKSYAMSGWRIGYLVASESMVKEFLKISQYSMTSLSPFSQRAASFALSSNIVQDEVLNMKRIYKERRDFIFNKVQGHRLFNKMFFPRGGFYVFIDISHFKMDSMSFVEDVLEKYNVSFTPGIAFGKEADSHIRMTFAVDLETIEGAINILMKL